MAKTYIGKERNIRAPMMCDQILTVSLWMYSQEERQSATEAVARRYPV